jgi:polysaccharide pyruvyl transferase WcaK-like protein
MIKIGILTYHYSINEGAMLQAYALQQICKKIFDNSVVEIVNYESLKARKRDFLFCLREPKNIEGVIRKFVHYYRLNKFKNKYFNTGKLRYLGDDYFKAIKFLNKQKYDLVIVGSDEVWKVSFKDDFARSFPNIYWLGHEIYSKKLAYAASAHKTLYDRLSDRKKRFIVKSFQRFDLIGVRDDYTFNLVKLCLKDKSENKLFKVLDPTFLYDFSQEADDIENIFLKNKINLSRPIAIFLIENDEISKMARKFLKNKNYQIISISHYNKYADFNLDNQMGPLDWAAAFKKSNFCLTDRFHGAVFSIKNQLPFISVDHIGMYKEFKSKTKQLLEDFELEYRLIDFSNIHYEYDEFADKIELCLNFLEKEKVEKNLEYKKRNSLNFLAKFKIDYDIEKK